MRGVGDNLHAAGAGSNRPGHQPPASSPRAGVSLLELLIVLLIILMVTAAAIPVLSPALQNRRMREASRLVSTYISGARSRAIEIGRPVGVMFERFEGKPHAFVLSYVEVPPPYAGDDTYSVCTVTPSGIDLALNMGGSFNAGLIRRGDRIQLNFQGPTFLVDGPDLNTDGVIDTGTAIFARNDLQAFHPWSNFSPPLPAVPYQIFRQPVRSSAAPLQLPDGAIVDLALSGVGLGGVFNAGIGPSPPTAWAPIVPFNPAIIFTPGGRVDSVWTNVPVPPTGPIFFLVGLRELMPDVSKSQQDENLYDPNDPGSLPAPAPGGPPPRNLCLQNYWVSVAPDTGQITVSENGKNPGYSGLPLARQYGQSGQGVGGL